MDADQALSYITEVTIRIKLVVCGILENKQLKSFIHHEDAKK